MARSGYRPGCGDLVVVLILGGFALHYFGPGRGESAKQRRAVETSKPVPAKPAPSLGERASKQVAGLGSEVDTDMRPLAEALVCKWRAQLAFGECKIRRWKRVELEGQPALTVIHRIRDNLTRKLRRYGADSDALDIAKALGGRAPADAPEDVLIVGQFPLKDRLGTSRWHNVQSYFVRMADLRAANWNNLYPDDLKRLAVASTDTWPSR